MRSPEAALRAVRAQVQFALAEAMADVAHAAAASLAANEKVADLTHRVARAAEELRDVMQRAQINPPLLTAMRTVHQLDAQALRDWQQRLSAAQEHEQEARAVLADLRNRERSLDRALRAEQRKHALQQQARDMLDVDDLWLQHSWRVSP